MAHYFTLEEANAAVEIIKPMMEELMIIRQDILASQPEVWPVIEKAAGNGGSRAASLMARSFERLDQLVHRIVDTGALLKDINTGLLKAAAYGLIIGLAGCWRGLQADRSAVGVGVAATRAVVTAILLIIVSDAIFAVVFNILHW